jgi:hypothetical protein
MATEVILSWCPRNAPATTCHLKRVRAIMPIAFLWMLYQVGRQG